MQRLAYGGIAAALGAVLLWVFLPQPPKVEIAQVTRGDLKVEILAEGEARIREIVVVSAPISGLLQRIDLHPGDTVSEGQTVARIGPAAPALLDARARAVAEAAVAAALAAVDLAQSQLAEAEATQEFARTEADRARALFARGALADRLMQSAILADRTGTAAVASAKAALAVRLEELQSARAVLDGGQTAGAPCCVEVQAAEKGRVLRIFIADEQVVQAGTPLLEMGNTGDMEVVAHVLSGDAVQIAPGAEAVVTGWGGPEIAARVMRVDPSATTHVSALGIEEQRVEVRMALVEPPPLGLGHGFRITAHIAVWEGQDVLRVPVAALLRVGGDWAAYVVEDGRARLRHLSLGARNETYAEVEAGLEAGDEIILHPTEAVVADGRVAP